MTVSLSSARDRYSNDALIAASRRFRRIVLWGLTSPAQHTHHHIYQAYFRVCKLLGLNVVWVDESETNAEQVQPDDLVFIHGSTNFMIQNILVRKPVIVDFHVNLNRERLGGLLDLVASYPRRITERELHEPDAVYLDAVTSYSTSSKILTQPWGTDLLPTEFASPSESHWSDKLYWVGSIWPGGWGNFDEILSMKATAESNGLKFVQLTDCSTAKNRFFISQSRIGPSIGGAGQARENYLACRFYKNISYGQFCISNVAKSQEVLAGSAIYDTSVSEAVGLGLEVSPERARELLRFQQHCIRNFTVAAHLYLIIVAATEYSCV